MFLKTNRKLFFLNKKHLDIHNKKIIHFNKMFIKKLNKLTQDSQ